MYSVLAQLTFTDPAAYQQYLDRFMAVFAEYEGKVLAADIAPDLIQGQWQGDKIVLLSFADEGRFQRWTESPEYCDIAKLRRADANGPILGIRGFS